MPTKKPANTSREADRTSAYALDVVEGRIVVGPHVRNACARHLRDLENGGKRGLVWDVERAAYVIRFFPAVLKLAGGQFEGRTFELHPSQAFVVGSLFGWKRKSDGLRRFRRAYLEEGKGNGKTPLAAGIGLFCMVSDDEPRAEIYAAASKRDQAMVLFRDAVAMREQSPRLRERITTSGANPVWNLADLRSGSFFRPISSEDGQSGPRPSCALCDEVHEHRDGRVIEMLERGFKWRRQPLLLMTTNSGSDRNSVCWQEHRHAVDVAAGDVEDDSEFAYVCALDDGDDPLEDPACWVKANPLLDVTITTTYLAEVVAQAKAIPGKLNGILRYHFCVWTDAEQAWMARPTLEACLADFDPAIHAGKPVALGGDLSATQDLTAIAAVVETGRDKEGRPLFDAWVEAWTPEDTVSDRAVRDQAPYETWIKDGWLNATPGKVIGFDFVAARIAEIVSRFGVKAFAYDRYGFNKFFEPELDALGLTLPIVEHPQGGKKKGAESGLWMPGSKMALESLILEKRIRLRRSPVLISAMMSAAIEGDPFGNFWFSKRRAVNRIDALIALAMAVGAATMAPAVEPEKEYQIIFA